MTEENENTANHNLWDASKAVLGGKFTAINIHAKKKISTYLYLKGLEKEEQTKPKVNRMKEIRLEQK